MNKAGVNTYLIRVLEYNEGSSKILENGNVRVTSTPLTGTDLSSHGLLTDLISIISILFCICFNFT
jgi:hypothetical protein